jgi:predicted transcriptional regulator
MDAKEFVKTVKLNRLKMRLAATDYKAIKYAEGLYTPEEYAATKAERETLRAQIRALEEGKSE